MASYWNISDLEVTAICDIDPSRLKDVGNRYGIGARHSDYRKITEDPEIDVVSICSHDDGHAEQCISSFRNGKHVMVEKPVALFRDKGEAVMRAQQDSGRLITSNLILRASPRFQELRRQIGAGAFGEIFYIEGDYLHDILRKITEGWRGKMDFYCVVYGGGIHMIDLMRWLIGRDVDEVFGMGNKILSRDSDYRFEDSIVSVLRFQGGAIGKCFTTFGPQRTKFHALNVYGTKKTFMNDLPHAKLFEGSAPDDERVVTTPYPGMQKGDLIPDFVAAIREGREPLVSARDVFRVMDICFATWESVQQGRPVTVSYMI